MKHRKFWRRVALVVGLIAVAAGIYLAYHHEVPDTRVETHHVAP